jgi:hypothetical protein
MNSSKNTTLQKRNKHRIQVGDRVRLRFANSPMTGIVTEDRGPIGVKGRRLLRIHLNIDGEERAIELPAQDVKAF